MRSGGSPAGPLPMERGALRGRNRSSSPAAGDVGLRPSGGRSLAGVG